MDHIDQMFTPIDLDWWIVAAACSAILHDRELRDGAPPFSWLSEAIPNGYRWERTIDGNPAGTITITGQKNGRTLVHMQPGASGADTLYWNSLQTVLSRFGKSARNVRRHSIGPTVDALIEEYNRAQAAGEHVTLRQLAKDADISYSYVRKRKSLKETKQKGNKEGNAGNI